MAITDVLVVPPDVLITPVRDMPARLRRKIGAADGEFVVTRPGTRAPSMLIDGSTAQLLERLRTPASIVHTIQAQACTDFTRAESLLDQVGPMIAFCYAQDILVELATAEISAAAIAPTLGAGDRIGRFTIESCLRALSDSEVYRARDAHGGHVAIKVGRPHAKRHVVTAIKREAPLLQSLDGRANVTVAGQGTVDGRVYIATHWAGRPEPSVRGDGVSRAQRRDRAKASLVVVRGNRRRICPRSRAGRPARRRARSQYSRHRPTSGHDSRFRHRDAHGYRTDRRASDHDRHHPVYRT